MKDMIVGIVFLVLCSTVETMADAVMRGVGTSSCADFGQAYKGDPKLAEAVYMSWAQGFMAGMNVERDNNHAPMRDIPAADRLSILIRSYCDKHPLGPFFQAAQTIYGGLPRLVPQSN